MKPRRLRWPLGPLRSLAPRHDPPRSSARTPHAARCRAYRRAASIPCMAHLVSCDLPANTRGGAMIVADPVARSVSSRAVASLAAPTAAASSCAAFSSNPVLPITTSFWRGEVIALAAGGGWVHPRQISRIASSRATAKLAAVPMLVHPSDFLFDKVSVAPPVMFQTSHRSETRCRFLSPGFR